MPKHKFTPEETKRGQTGSSKLRASRAASKAQVKSAQTDAIASIFDSAAFATSNILQELVKASNSNPMIGILLTIVVADVLRTNKVISNLAYKAIMLIIGVDVAVDEISGIISIVGSLLGQRANLAELAKPSAVTIVYGNQGTGLKAEGTQGGLAGLIPAILAAIPK